MGRPLQFRGRIMGGFLGGGVSLMEHRDAAQVAAGPFRLIDIHIRIDGLEEGSHEGDLQHGSHNASLVPDIPDWARSAAPPTHRRDRRTPMNIHPH